MIDWIKSAEMNNCTVEWLKARFVRFPNSDKRVWRVCGGKDCNDERTLKFRDCYLLCHACAMKQPKVREAARLKTIEQFSDPAQRDAARLKSLEYWSDPAHQGIKLPPKTCTAMSKSHKESKAAKDQHETMRGGNDIVMHHWLYDDADLSKYTIPMTRSEHMIMHRRMQLDGYKVPHINSETDDNGLWGYK